ncbi:MAG: Lrp/AsnC ligand binding domain-containing protein [Nitrospirae bacterium]|nr:Lrp/AsnC ligand binding domain-containing protein [Nitrospirota bacterium]
MAKVYLLANTMPGKERDIRDKLRAIKGVSGADLITGVYDVIAVIESKDLDSIFKKILKDIRGLKGISRTETFIAVE